MHLTVSTLVAVDEIVVALLCESLQGVLILALVEKHRLADSRLIGRQLVVHAVLHTIAAYRGEHALDVTRIHNIDVALETVGTDNVEYHQLMAEEVTLGNLPLDDRIHLVGNLCGDYTQLHQLRYVERDFEAARWQHYHLFTTSTASLKLLRMFAQQLQHVSHLKVVARLILNIHHVLTQAIEFLGQRECHWV